MKDFVIEFITNPVIVGLAIIIAIFQLFRFIAFIINQLEKLLDYLGI